MDETSEFESSSNNTFSCSEKVNIIFSENFCYWDVSPISMNVLKFWSKSYAKTELLVKY